MASCSGDFPFGIMDVVELLQIRVRRRSPQGVYVDCPFCNDRRGKMHVHVGQNTWHCNYCKEGGGMLGLYARMYNTNTSDAFREICDALMIDDHTWGAMGNTRRNEMGDSERSPLSPRNTYAQIDFQEVPQSKLASAQEIHQTYSVLLDSLSLRSSHRAHLRSEKRGLSDEQIERFRFKSTPPPYICRSLTARLIRLGCKVEGVPGFYQDKNGNWTVRFTTVMSGILLPVVGFDGLIKGMQILLDKPMKYKDDPPDKKGAKYIWFSSAGKTMGVSSGSPVMLIGNPSSRTVYVTEGILKAYIAHAVMTRTFISTAGSNSIDQLRPMFQFLAQNGTELIIEAEDMDKYSNEAVAKCASNVYLLARSFGMEYRRLTWNPNYKGIDDWQLALRRRDRRIKEENAMSFKEKYLLGLCDFENIFDYIELWHKRPDDGVGLARFLGLTDSEYATLCSKSDAVLETILKAQRRGQRFRIYQLDFDKENPTIPFAFRGIDDLHAAGHDHPPAAKYKLIWDDVIICPTAWQEEEVLRHIAAHYGDHMPEQYLGRPVSPSDVIELYDDECRRYFYVDTSGFVSVRFAPFLAKPMKDLDEESS